MKISDITNALQEKSTKRPQELGQGYFWINRTLVNILPHSNHRAWLVANHEILSLPQSVEGSPETAMALAMLKNILRILWDENTKTLYINGQEKQIWNSISRILFQHPWVEKVSCVVIEYAKENIEKQGKISWYGSDIFSSEKQIECLYKGKRISSDNTKPTENVVAANRLMNILNEHPKPVLEMFSQHSLSFNFVGPQFGSNRKKILDAPVDYLR